jgi:hypothetical protein
MGFPTEQDSRSRRLRWVWWAAGSLLAFWAGLTIVAIVLAHRIEPFLRERIVDGLATHFHARVELDAFHVTLGNGFRGEWGVWAQGRGLRIWPPATVAGVTVPGAPNPEDPLIQLEEFGFHAPLRYKSGQPIYISDVRLKGLSVHMPPKSHFIHLDPSAAPPPRPHSPYGSFRIDLGNLDCTGVNLVLETSKPGKLPMEISIAHIRLKNVTPNAAMQFEAELTNPRPVGSIHTKGTFGPWKVEDPGESPLAGDYRFDHADLGTFKGIAGILNSTGHYEGTLRNITADGETDTPDFRLSNFNNPADLHTHFHALIDGTNGDTWLEPVDATLAHSHIIAKGQVVRVQAVSADGSSHSVGHDIDLNVTVDKGRIEDFVKLASHSTTPPLTGDVVVKSTLHIPPGPEHVIKRMELKGQFALDQTQFTSDKVQDRIKELSLRGQGKPHDVKSTDSGTIVADMRGDFKMANGVIELPDLDFTVPGADIGLKGTYTLDGGLLNFIGQARLEASVSKIVGGWKGFLLKPADRFFKKDGAGTEVPIHVSGTREHPDFGVDVKGMKHTHPQSPGQQPAKPNPDSAPVAPPRQ